MTRQKPRPNQRRGGHGPYSIKAPPSSKAAAKPMACAPMVTEAAPFAHSGFVNSTIAAVDGLAARPTPMPMPMPIRARPANTLHTSSATANNTVPINEARLYCGKDLRKAPRLRPRRPAIALIASVACDELTLAHATRTLAVLRNDPLTPKIRKHPKKHLLGVHQVVESETAGLARIGDNIVIGSEYAVRVAPGRNLFEAEFL